MTVDVPESTGAAHIQAAGVVALRGKGKRLEALVVHRPDRNDWSLPKGKLDPGERLAAAAVRETLEETGIAVTLGIPLQPVHYRVIGKRSDAAPVPKTVHYWRAQITDPAIRAGDVDVPDGWMANHEVGDVRWVRLSQLPAVLTYPHDLDVVMEATLQPEHTSPFIIVRHAQAERRGEWRAIVGEDPPDVERPLTAAGEHQARALADVLAAYGVRTVSSSSALRCMDTVAPYAGRIGVPICSYDSITEQAFAEHPRRGVRDVLAMLEQPAPGVLCIHRPTKKRLMRAIGDETGQFVNLALQPAEYLVFHRIGKRDEEGRWRKVRLGDSTNIEYGLHDLAQ